MHRTSLASLLALSLAACGGDPAVDTDAGERPDAGGVVDGGPLEDGAVPPDAGGDEDGGTVGEDGGPPGECGGARPDVSGITGTEGLVIARDGTIYYSQSGGVGRMTPDGTQDDEWLSIAGAGTIWGLALDAANERLYVAAPSMTRANGRIYRVDLTAATPTASEFVSAAGGANGMTMGPDAALYFSDFYGGFVYRVALGGGTGTATAVSTSTIASPNGLAFVADGSVLVASYGTGVVHRLTISPAGVETARVQFASGLGRVDGLALDADARVYVTDQQAGRVVRLEADGGTPMELSIPGAIPGPANLEFGSGTLDCGDLYIASAGGSLVRYTMSGAVGAPVPWH